MDGFGKVTGSLGRKVLDGTVKAAKDEVAAIKDDVSEQIGFSPAREEKHSMGGQDSTQSDQASKSDENDKARSAVQYRELEEEIRQIREGKKRKEEVLRQEDEEKKRQVIIAQQERSPVLPSSPNKKPGAGLASHVKSSTTQAEAHRDSRAG